MGDLAAMVGAKADDDEKEKEKSNKLWPWGTAPAQLLNACGSNHLSDAELPALWKVLAQGNKSVPFFYEGLDEDTLRQSVGVSRAAQAIQAFVTDVLQGPHMEHVLKDGVRKNATKEAADLLPHLQTLNAAGLPMPDSKTKDDRKTMFKRQRTEAPVPDTAKVESAATALHTWINKRPSDLKLLMMIFGANGLSHNAQVYEKCLRAHVSERQLDKNAFVAMMLKRFEGVKTSESSGPGDLTAFKG